MQLITTITRKIAAIVIEATRQFIEDRAWRQGAALSYYAIISLAPMLLIILRVASLFAVQELTITQIIASLDAIAGPEITALVEGIIDDTITVAPRRGVTLLNITVLLVAATALLANVKATLDRIWYAGTDAGRGIVNVLKTRTLALFLIGIAAVLVMGLIILNSMLVIVGHFVSDYIPWLSPGQVQRVIANMGRLELVVYMVVLMYRLLPDVPISWREALLGGIVTALLVAIGNSIILLYLRNATIASAYGAAGSVVVLLVWIYYSALVFLYGAEITYVYTHFDQIQEAKQAL